MDTLVFLEGRVAPGLNGGAAPPPPGVIPNFENPPDAGRIATIAVFAVCYPLSTALFATRIYSKIVIIRQLVLEDVIRHGMGYHTWDVAPDEYAEMLEVWVYITSILYEPAAYFTKVTLLLLLARVFAVHTKISKGIHYFNVALLIAYIPLLAVKIALCQPIPGFWRQDVEGRCLDLREILIIDVAFAIATDTLIFTIPIPLIWQLRTPWTKKIKFVLLLGAGGAATAFTVYRLVLLNNGKDVAADFAMLDLLTYVSLLSITWQLLRWKKLITCIPLLCDRMLELTIGLVCSCLPAVNILIDRIRKPPRPRPANGPRTGRFHRGESGKRVPFTWNWIEVTQPDEQSQSGRSERQLNSTEDGGLSTHHATTVESQPERTQERAEFNESENILNQGDDDIMALNGGCSPCGDNSACYGHREGWLCSCAHKDRDRDRERGLSNQQEETPISLGRNSEGEKSRAVSSKLADISGQRQWDYIFDGRSNSHPPIKRT
ncbi:unnamed protein product [Clonostachys byssicola]|uniref:Rhodopsin domain-containing protein n=1 Tax=Clonostachys byssicola TaxID=160290 RepID=A0A9N9U2Q8_9HYPO|nr:unnamed protein product [Clonostachys byssicola]